MPDDWVIWRAARLAALAEAPMAFASSAEQEAAYDEAWWRERMTVGVWVAAMNGGEAVGIVGGYVRPDRDGTARLVSMWVRPSFRGQRIAKTLAAEVIGWSREQRVGAVELWVIDGNAGAQAVYERLGFTFTGEDEPNALRPELRQRRMVRGL
jgi:RimJ/RimL family protein N-acetyltransferase